MAECPLIAISGRKCFLWRWKFCILGSNLRLSEKNKLKKFNPILFRIQCILDHKIVGPYLVQRKKKYHKKHGPPPRVNIGGGNFLRHNWVNIDYPSKWYPYKEGVIDCKFDLTSGDPFPFEDNSIELFYSSHCMEHICSENFEHIFSEIYRSLKPGGGIRITVPCYDMLYDKYEEHRKEDQNGSREFLDTFLNGFASYFMDRVPVDEFQKNFETMSRSELADHYCSQIPRDLHKDTAGHHINWWNFEKMKKLLEKI